VAEVQASVHHVAHVGFERGAGAYERGRPGYPNEVLAWLGAELRLHPGTTVADVAAGTGKLTAALVETGAQVLAVEPVEAMRQSLQASLPEVKVLAGTAEKLPLPAWSVDAITVAQAFHWFDGDRALAEFHRVLRPGGRLALVWNGRDLEQPLQIEIEAVFEPHRGTVPSHHTGRWREAIARTALFAAAGRIQKRFVQRLDSEGLVDRVVSVSFIAALDPREREAVAEQARRIAAAHGGEVQLDYETEALVFERTGEPIDITYRR
jgi:SAM-dependent methyltransferase